MRKLLASVALAAALVVPGVLRAAEEASEKVDISPFSLSAGVDYVTSYVFRGYELTDTGTIIQPFVQLNAKVHESDSLTITPYIGTWNSIQSDYEPGEGQWYESDIYGGIDFGMNKFTLGVIYTYYSYPDNAFGTTQEVGVKLSYDDTDASKDIGLPFALKPYAAWYIEISDENGDQDQYAEVGINPSIAPEDWPVSFNFPIAVGLSPNGYFADDDGSNELFGYASVGAFATYALPISEKFGAWSIYGGATYYFLSADSVQNGAGEDTDYEIVGKVGLTFAY